MIEDALHEVGAARSIVIDEAGVVLAGNATLEAAGAAGITRVQVVDADGQTIVAVRRKGLTARQKQRLALFDNRTAELAEWDDAQIESMLKNDQKIAEGLFREDEVAKMLGDDPEWQQAESGGDAGAISRVVITVSDVHVDAVRREITPICEKYNAKIV